MSVVENIQNVRAKIAAAAEKSGRTAEGVLLLAVSKTKPVELIGEAVQAGCLSLGENKVQEIMEKLPEADVVFVPIGGGGLISGVACAIKSINPNCKVYGVQAEGAPSMKQSIEHKKIEKLASVSTMADGIAVKEPGTLTFEACMKYVDGIVTVTEAEIASAILMLLEKHKMVAEGAGAVSVAAAMTNKVDIKGKNVVCVVSGGNVDVNVLDRIIDKGLQENC